MNRRSFLRTSAVAAAAAPLLVLRELTKPPSRGLPHVRSGEIMRVQSWNELVDRVNDLSQR